MFELIMEYLRMAWCWDCIEIRVSALTGCYCSDISTLLFSSLERTGLHRWCILCICPVHCSFEWCMKCMCAFKQPFMCSFKHLPLMYESLFNSIHFMHSIHLSLIHGLLWSISAPLLFGCPIYIYAHRWGWWAYPSSERTCMLIPVWMHLDALAFWMSLLVGLILLASVVCDLSEHTCMLTCDLWPLPFGCSACVCVCGA